MLAEDFFNARTLASLSHKHLNLEPRPPREWIPLSHSNLNGICVRLLARILQTDLVTNHCSMFWIDAEPDGGD